MIFSGLRVYGLVRADIPDEHLLLSLQKKKKKKKKSPSIVPEDFTAGMFT